MNRSTWVHSYVTPRSYTAPLKLRCANIKATIWQNVMEKDSFFATTFSRPFRDQSGA